MLACRRSHQVCVEQMADARVSSGTRNVFICTVCTATLIHIAARQLVELLMALLLLLLDT